uniref:Ig-like domain-containing protein n=1 Tax=Macrostomum lignano TaxID=282301 RepID=A0A1I8JI33_9PLAT
MFKISVKKRLSIVVKPENVKMSTPDSEASFKCRISGGSSSRSLLWYNNGRFVSPRDSEGPAIQVSTIRVRKLNPSIRGIFQCIASDPEADIWESANALLTVQGDTLQRPTEPAVPTPARPPIDEPAGATTNPSTTDKEIVQFLNSTKSVTYKLLKPGETFQQIKCGSQFEPRSNYVFTFYKDNQLINVTPSKGPILNPYMQFENILGLVSSTKFGDEKARFQGVYKCRVTQKDTGRLLFVQTIHAGYGE